ncbi:MAG TPA: protein translocase subunit SecF [Patescibacteria group bacterium]|nr:protein translocase subunit SecF [Patescibacteria group bacterium]
MINVIGKKNLFFILSGIVIIPGLISTILFGLKPGIDFTGGSRLEFSYKNSIANTDEVKSIFNKNTKVDTISTTGPNTISVRTEPIDEKTKKTIIANLAKEFPGTSEKSFQTIGPSIGKETEVNAFKAVLIASVAITLYIAFAFRKVSKPVSSWKYGVCAIAALLHDVLAVIGIFSILGHFFGVEIDSLFITALLTVMGFSVHDTIVVFDRIRENLSKSFGHQFEDVVNDSLLETMNRSVNTSLTVLIVLFALLVFGGESIRWFVAALLIGIISGTYSSIFNASPLLVVWYEWDKRKKKRKK